MIDVANSDILNKDPINVSLYILPCPLGLMLDFTSGDCVCDNDISHISGVICNISWMPYPIQRSGNNWISYRYRNHNCTMVHTGCPFDYCNTASVKFNLNESDLQCNYNRSGILCGQCASRLSLMLGSNRCADCTQTSVYVTISLIILIAVAGIALVALVKLANLTISVGSINGLLFYGYIVKVNESVFFPDGDIPVISQFIAWINLDLGFEYCFVPQLDGYLKTWMQFVFPLYLWLLVLAIVVVCRYSGRVSRLWTKGDNSLSTLATLILMPYSKMLRNITNTFSFNPVSCGVIKYNVWILDGNIEYFGTKHAFLFTVSFLFFLIGLIYTVLLLSVQWLQRYSGKCCKGTRDPIVRLKPLLDVYTGPYRDKHRFWTGLRLIIHLCLTLLFALTNGMYSVVNNYIICVTVFFLTSITINQRKIRLRYQEMLSYINLFMLALLSAVFGTQSLQHIVPLSYITTVSVAIEILLFIVVVTVQVCQAIHKMCCCCKGVEPRVRTVATRDEELLSAIDDRED